MERTDALGSTFMSCKPVFAALHTLCAK